MILNELKQRLPLAINLKWNTTEMPDYPNTTLYTINQSIIEVCFFSFGWVSRLHAMIVKSDSTWQLQLFRSECTYPRYWERWNFYLNLLAEGLKVFNMRLFGNRITLWKRGGYLGGVVIPCLSCVLLSISLYFVHVMFSTVRLGNDNRDSNAMGMKLHFKSENAF